MSAAAHVRRLQEILRRAADAYYNGLPPLMTDAEYDRLLRELVDLEAQNPHWIVPVSPTQTVGASPAKTARTLQHAEPMLSLENAANESEFDAWVAGLARQLDDPASCLFAIEEKFDGLAFEVVYQDGLLRRALTRGDGHSGEDITANALEIRNLPAQLTGSFPERLDVRGEILVPLNEFEQLNEERRRRGQPPFANPRNLAAGSVKQNDPRITATRPLEAVFYDLGHVASHEALPGNETNLLTWLAAMGLPVATHWTGNVAAIKKHYVDLLASRATNDHEIDGTVIKIHALALRRELGQRQRTPRWAIAWKFPPAQEMSVLKNIEVQVGRSGALTPVAHIDPVRVSGVTVSRVTLHNAEEIARLDLRMGDGVLIERRGDVIPKIVAVTPAQPRAASWTPPVDCPRCATPVMRKEGQVAWLCPNATCPSRVAHHIRHLASRQALDIEGLGEKWINILLERELIADAADLFTLKTSALQALDRMGEKSSGKLLAAIATAKTRDLWRWINALGIPHVGEATSRLLADRFGSLEALAKANEESLTALPDVGPEVARSLNHWFASAENKLLMQNFQRAGIAPLPPAQNKHSSGTLTGKTLVFTGTLPTLGRSEAQGLARGAGAKISSSVSRQTDFVVAGEKAGSKLTQAKDLGVPVWSEEDFLAQIRAE